MLKKSLQLAIGVALVVQLTGCYYDGGGDRHYHPWWHHHDVVVVHDVR